MYSHAQIIHGDEKQLSKVMVVGGFLESPKSTLSNKYFSLDPVNGTWGAWSDWSSCSESCEGGTEERVRICLSSTPASCQGDQYEESRICNNYPCKIQYFSVLFHCLDLLGPVDGSWGSWADWSECSQSCGGGTETRRRLCDSPAPAQGGTDCQGDQHQERQCNTETCHGKVKGKIT